MENTSPEIQSSHVQFSQVLIYHTFMGLHTEVLPLTGNLGLQKYTARQLFRLSFWKLFHLHSTLKYWLNSVAPLTSLKNKPYADFLLASWWLKWIIFKLLSPWNRYKHTKWQILSFCCEQIEFGFLWLSKA